MEDKSDRRRKTARFLIVGPSWIVLVLKRSGCRTTYSGCGRLGNRSAKNNVAIGREIPHQTESRGSTVRKIQPKSRRHAAGNRHIRAYCEDDGVANCKAHQGQRAEHRIADRIATARLESPVPVKQIT